MSRQPILILGAGPAGLACAWQLARRGFEVIVAERGPSVGGNAASFDFEGQAVDYGSHRLHPSCSHEILADIRHMLGADLLDRPRHGRIRLMGRWLHFPLKPGDLLMNAPPSFAAGVLTSKITRPPQPHRETFASVLERGLGRTICREFYFPYARKIWGIDPSELDPEQARRRVSAGSLIKLAKKVLAPSRTAHFFYPRNGFGEISRAYADAAVKAGAVLLFNTSATGIELKHHTVASVTLHGGRKIEAKLVLSTIPLPRLVQIATPEPIEVRDAAVALEYRAMILIYLALDTPQFTEFDAHYFPALDIGITRLSEPKNYSLHGPPDRTVLCAELPCSPGDPAWTMSDDALAKLVLQALDRAGIPYHGKVLRTTSRRLPEAYPVYRLGYRGNFDQLDAWVSSLHGLVSLGRQGLFAHDNTHHTLAMAYAAARCVHANGSFDRSSWTAERDSFNSFVVED